MKFYNSKIAKSFAVACLLSGPNTNNYD